MNFLSKANESLSLLVDHSAGSCRDIASAEKQAIRRQQVQRLHRNFWFDRFNDQGGYSEESCRDFRQRMWHTMSFLNGDDSHIKRANAMLVHLTRQKSCHFWTSGVTSILARFKDRIESGLYTTLIKMLGDALHIEATERFRGYNDNYPAMAALSSIVGGELTGQPDAVAGGIANLQTMQQLLTRRGFLSEYASPTYTAITLTCLAEIVELAQTPQARELALAGEQRVWWEVASRFHAPTSTMAGPHSRAYMIDMVANTHNIHVSLYQVLGEDAFINPVSTMFPPIDGQAQHGGLGLPMAHGAWQTTPTYHMPQEAVDLALNKTFPCTIEADAEQAAFSRNVWKNERHEQTPFAEFQCSDSHLVTYMTQDFALGSNSRKFLDGWQNTSSHLVYRRKQANALQDITTMFDRYLINNPSISRHEHLGCQGRSISLQHESTVMVMSWAKPAWGSMKVGIDTEMTPVCSLKQSLLMPCFWAQPDAIWLGDQQCESWVGHSDVVKPIFIHDGPVYIAIHALSVENVGRQNAICLEQQDDFGIISLINYEGEPRPFSPAELVSCRNGYVLEVDQASNWGSFETFREFHAAPQIKDRWDAADAMRTVSYQRKNLLLEIAASPFSEGIKHRSINGKLVRSPKLAIPEVNVNQLPWM